MPTLNANQVTAPGTYVSEDVAGIIPAALASFNRCYMIGTGTTGLNNKPTQVISEADFVAQFGTSPEHHQRPPIFSAITRRAFCFLSAQRVRLRPTLLPQFRPALIQISTLRVS
jgi:uncharacterized protein